MPKKRNQPWHQQKIYNQVIKNNSIDWHKWWWQWKLQRQWQGANVFKERSIRRNTSKLYKFEKIQKDFWHGSTFLTQIDRKQKFCSLVCQFQKGKNRLDRTKFDVAKHGSTFWPCRHRSTKLWRSVCACCVEWVSLPKWDATAKKSSIFYLASLKFWSEWVVTINSQK